MLINVMFIKKHVSLSICEPREYFAFYEISYNGSNRGIEGGLVNKIKDMIFLS